MFSPLFWLNVKSTCPCVSSFSFVSFGFLIIVILLVVAVVLVPFKVKVGKHFLFYAPAPLNTFPPPFPFGKESWPLIGVYKLYNLSFLLLVPCLLSEISVGRKCARLLGISLGFSSSVCLNKLRIIKNQLSFIKN